MVFGNMNLSNIIKRRQGLGEFLLQLLKDDNMGDSQEVLEFLGLKDTVKETPIQTSKSEEKDVYITLFDYKKQDDTELDLKKGENIKVIEKDENSGWWYGHSIETPKICGFFPNNYLIQVDTTSKLYIVEFDFIGEGSNELTIKKGEELELLEKKNGWCQVTNSKKQKGWVPEDFIIPKSK